MEKPRVLSGEALVAKGITKIDASLPEVGLKDVTPNGSWLEQKQVQHALEARKYLVEVERIEKCGTLSHAEWRDDLMLAEVTQKTGGYWQYLGHNVGKTLYLQPEEALFLMEVNCLLLKHNDVTVSLQKAYSLLLNSSTTIKQYKVYASLSRLGYRVFRHAGPKVEDTKKNYSNKKKEMMDVDPESHSMDVISKNVDSPTAATNKSEVFDSPKASVENVPKNEDFSIVSAEKESDSVIESVVSPVIISENVSSLIVSVSNESKNEESSAISTTNECEKAQSDEPIENSVNDLKTVNTLIVETVINSEMTETVTDSKMTETPKDDDTIENLENHASAVESQANQPNKNEQEQIPKRQQDTSSERNGNIVEMVEANDSKEIAQQAQQEIEQLDAENSVAKENESPNIMEVNDFAEIKTTQNKIEAVEEILSTIAENKKNCENNIDSMEICTKTQEADVVLMEEDDDISKGIETSSTEESTTITKTSDTPIVIVKVVETSKDAVSATNLEVTRRDAGSKTNGDSPNHLEVPNLNNSSDSNKCTATENKITQNNDYSEDGDSYNFLAKIEKLRKRQLRPSDSKTMERYFENIPDFSRGCVVTINAPEQQFIPKNIFVNKAAYTLNLQNIVMRSNRSASSESPSYTSSDEVNGTNIRRIRSASEVLSTYFPQNANFFSPGRFQRYPYRPYGFWRPQNNLSNVNFCQLLFFQTRFQYLQYPPRPPSYNIHPNNHSLSNNARKRMRCGKSAHFQGIKNLAVRLRQSLISGNTDMGNLESLHGLLHAYNSRYKTRLRLTEHFDVVNEEKIVETIELDDDEESKSKKPRLEKDDDDKFDENLYRLRQLALRLSDLESKDEATARHRRAFSKAIKTFNKSYNADVYLDQAYAVIDKRCITLDSGSESDCVIEEQVKVRSKKLRNPFNILKRRKEREQTLNNPGTSKEDNTSDQTVIDPAPTEADGDCNKYSELIQTFSKAWLPNEEDFGRAEIVSKRSMNLEISNKELFLHEYMKSHFQPFKNWLEAKLSFLEDLEETNNAFKRQKAQILADSEVCNTGLQPLIDFEDSADMPTLLEKLRIIDYNKEIDTETCLRIDFDVYNRNVQNFRKRNPPKPHFRIICMDESSGIPPAEDVMSLHSKYEDNVPVVFAIVSTGSISYLQINPIDLPIYVPNRDVE